MATIEQLVQDREDERERKFRSALYFRRSRTRRTRIVDIVNNGTIAWDSDCAVDAGELSSIRVSDEDLTGKQSDYDAQWVQWKREYDVIIETGISEEGYRRAVSRGNGINTDGFVKLVRQLAREEHEAEKYAEPAEPGTIEELIRLKEWQASLA